MLTHVDEKNRPAMVDVLDKAITPREAVARSRVRLPEEVRPFVRDGEIQSKKGPVIDTAIIAGTMAVKRTHDLIPFCHPLPIGGCRIQIDVDDEGLEITCTVRTRHNTGVEMEALTGASVAALTVYDMLKAVSHKIVITETALIRKTGGKRDVDQS